MVFCANEMFVHIQKTGRKKRNDLLNNFFIKGMLIHTNIIQCKYIKTGSHTKVTYILV